MSRPPTPLEEARKLLDDARASAREKLDRGEPLEPPRLPFGNTAWAAADARGPADRRAAVHRSWPDRLPRADGRRRLLLGVTTFDRADYLDGFLEGFARTRSTEDDWWLVIADDGSTDDSHDVAAAWAERLGPEVSFLRVQNHAAGIAGQTNSILQCILAIDPDLAFVANDDLEFLRPGWVDAWWDAVQSSGYDHLVLFDEAWRDPIHEEERPGLRSLTDARGCMGAFYTVTPALVREIGFFDEENFPVRGHSHIDWTVRACRSDANEDSTLWEVQDATSWIKLRPRDDYLETFDWTSERARRLFTPEERQRRMEVIDREERRHVPLPAAERRSRVVVTAQDEQAERVLALQPRLAPTRQRVDVDATVVLNLRDHVDRWDLTATQLAGAGLDPVRAEAIYGFAPEHAEQWQAYVERGLELPIEHEIGRRLIHNPGALGYLLSMERVLTEAIEQRYASLLVFDDDVHADHDAEERMTTALEHLPEDWLLWYLGATQKDWDVATELGNELYDTGGKADGSFALAMRAGAFPDLLACTREFDWPFDAGPVREVCRSYPSRCVASFPPIFIPDVSDSIIRQQRDMQGWAAYARWDLARYRDRIMPDQRTMVIVSVGASREDATAMLGTLNSLRRQDLPGQDVHVVVPEETPAAGQLVTAQQTDTRVTGWTCANDTVGAAELNTLKDLSRPNHLLLLTAGDVLPRNGLRRLLEALDTSPNMLAATLPAVLSPEGSAAPTVVDDPGLHSWSVSTSHGPTLFGPRALRSVGDLEAPGAFGAAVWLRRLRDRGEGVAVCAVGEDDECSWALRPLSTVEGAEQAASKASPLPPASLSRPVWGRERAPLTRLIAAPIDPPLQPERATPSG